MDVKELLLASFSSNKNTSVYLVNHVTSGVINSYKNGGAVEKHSMLQLGNEYILTGNKKEPKLHLWHVGNPDPLKKVRLILPNIPNCMAVCCNNIFLAVGIKTDLYIWQLSSGSLLTIQKRHYQNISVIKFSSCSNYLLTASEDGSVNAYKLVDLISTDKNNLIQTSIGNTEPLYSKNYHNLKITDLYINSLPNARFATSSLDQTVKICELHSGQLLLNLVFPSKIICVILDAPCWNLYSGSSDGSINRFDLTEPPRSVDCHITENSKNNQTFSVNNSPVLCISLNISGSVLAAGHENGHIYTFCAKTQQVLKKIVQEGPVTNILFVSSHVNFFRKQTGSQIAIETLQLVVGERNSVTIKQKCDIERPSRKWKLYQEKYVDDLIKENRFIRAQNNALFDIAKGSLQKN